ncbi:MAG: hypothetical protein H0W14_01085 [Actinobacteria bacterium]|nr:hypothetical protein [Actinomycetota bacterium]
MSALPSTSFLASRRGRRTIFLASLFLLVVGVAAVTIAYFGNTATVVQTPLSNEPAQVLTSRQQVPLDKQARRVAGRFILTAVARKNLGESYELTHPDLRQGLSRKDWLTGNIPVAPYPVEKIESATFKVDESYPDEAVLEVALLPPENAKLKPQIFFIGLKKNAVGWQVAYWVPRASPLVPDATE